MLETPLARPREPWETIGKSKEASDAAQWEHMQTGRVSEHFWAKSDYVRHPKVTTIAHLSHSCKSRSKSGLLKYVAASDSFFFTATTFSMANTR